MQDGKIVDIRNLRGEINEAISAGQTAEARQLLIRLWEWSPDFSVSGFVLSCIDKVRSELSLSSCRIAILRSFTAEPCVQLLRAAAAVRGIDIYVYMSDFNTYVQDILDQDSGLYRFSPDIVILAVQTRDVAPDLWNNFTSMSAAQINAAVERIKGDYENLVETFRSRSRAYLVIHTLEVPTIPSQGVFDCRSELGQTDAIRRINTGLARTANAGSGVYLLDYDALVARHGRLAWHDESKWLTMRMPITADHLIHLVNEWLRFIHPLSGRICKVLATDLDNTLWGGVIGEDGFNGIKVGPEYPGAAYQALQRVMLDLHERGILLAVCSKNNLDDARDVIERHPGMLLRPQHFSAMRINWNDKVQNLTEISRELNIGMDAIAFIDDNPVECRWVRTRMPEVTVIELPDDPMMFAGVLRDAPEFERLMISDEDKKRGNLYSEQRLREELQLKSSSLEDFYRSLQMEVEIERVTPENIYRIAQLTQKTNQFNMTTRRYSEQKIEEISASPDCRVYSLRLRDRFGDNGLVGVAIIRRLGDVCEIDTFLLSCRVIGRTVETSLLSFLLEQARGMGFRKVSGWFLPTAKNSPAKDFYLLHGFTCIREKNGQSLWEVDLTSAERIKNPPWIKLISLIG